MLIIHILIILNLLPILIWKKPLTEVRDLILEIQLRSSILLHKF